MECHIAEEKNEKKRRYEQSVIWGRIKKMYLCIRVHVWKKKIPSYEHTWDDFFSFIREKKKENVRKKEMKRMKKELIVAHVCWGRKRRDRGTEGGKRRRKNEYIGVTYV